MTHKTEPLPCLVFLEAGDDEPFTTDEIIASCAQVRSSTVTRLIRNHQKYLEAFGKVGFEIRANPSLRKD